MIMDFNTKWVRYIKENKMDMSQIINDYSKPIADFIKDGMTNIDIVKDEILFLQKKINKNDYGHHGSGEKQLMKLINGWLQEDLLKTMLQPLNCEINGTDVDRKIGVIPTNDPDLKIDIDGEVIFIEVTNINLLGNKSFDDSYDQSTSKFKNEMNWWQGRAHKYKNLLQQVKNKGDNVFLINTSDDFKSIMIKKIVKSNNTKEMKYKWHKYIGDGISLDDEYKVFSTKGLTNKEISDKIVGTIKEINNKY